MNASPFPARVRRLAGRALRRVERRVGHQIAPAGILGRRPPPQDKGTDTTSTPPSPLRPAIVPAVVPAKQVIRPQGTWSGHPLTAVRAAVLASDRFAHLLAPEWHQQRPQPGSDATTEVDLVLVQLDTDGVPGWPDHAAATYVSAAADSGLPIITWATAAGPTPEWLARCTTVIASDDKAAESLIAAGASVTRVAPFVQPLIQGPAGHSTTSSRRNQRIGIVLDDDAAFDVEQLREVLAPAVGRIERREIAMVATHEKHSPLVLPDGFPDRVQSVGAWAELGGTLGAVTAAMDLSGTAAWAPWTTMAAAMAATPLVGVEGGSGSLPPTVSTLIPRTSTAFDLRTDLGARMRQPELARREGHLLLRSVVREETAADRVRLLAGAAGITLPSVDRSVSAIVPTNRVHELDNVFINLGRQADADVELVLVAHGLSLPQAELQARAREAGVERLVVVEAAASLTLGACMNLGVEAASGRYIAKMDDDNFYGPQFLADLVDAFRYSGAGITGKWCHYVWLSSTKAVVLRFPDHEHRFGNRVQGGAMLFDADVVRSLRFSDIPRRVDSDILDRAQAEGIGIYSADPYNFVSIRSTDRHSHTWTVADSVFLTATGDLRFFGDPREHVTL